MIPDQERQEALDAAFKLIYQVCIMLDRKEPNLLPLSDIIFVCRSFISLEKDFQKLESNLRPG